MKKNGESPGYKKELEIFFMVDIHLHYRHIFTLTEEQQHRRDS